MDVEVLLCGFSRRINSGLMRLTQFNFEMEAGGRFVKGIEGLPGVPFGYPVFDLRCQINGSYIQHG